MKNFFDNLKYKISNFLEPYECDTDKFVNAWETTSVPFMVLSQICFFIWGYSSASTYENTSSTFARLIDALWYGFGGLLLYICLSALMFILAVMLDKRRVNIICIILGIIFTFFIYGAFV